CTGLLGALRIGVDGGATSATCGAAWNGEMSVSSSEPTDAGRSMETAMGSPDTADRTPGSGTWANARVLDAAAQASATLDVDRSEFISRGEGERGGTVLVIEGG
ncbi:MAG: hypothetical protein AAFP22_04515, partial [Planctomycetota bacterium]